MSHLGERVTTLVDGQLGAEAAERALIHIAGCARCRTEVETERLMKRRLSTLGAPSPEGDLVHRLLEMAGPSGPLPPRTGHVPGSPRPQFTSTSGRSGTVLLKESGRSLGTGAPNGVGPGIDPGTGVQLTPGFDLGAGFDRGAGLVQPKSIVAGPAAFTVPGRPPGRRGSTRPTLVRAATVSRMVRVSRSSRNRMAAAVVGAVCLVGAGVAGGIANGGVVDQRVVPPVDSFVLAHSITTSALPFNDQTVLWGSVGAGR